MEIISTDGKKLQEFFENIWKKIVGWFLKNKEKYKEFAKYGKALLERTAKTYAKRYLLSEVSRLRSFFIQNSKKDKNLDDYASLVKFMEQAFEWEEISYDFYSYYWGSKEDWPSLYTNVIDLQSVT